MTRYLLILLLGLCACGDGEKPGQDILKEIAGKIEGRRQQGPTAEEIRASATPEALAQIGKPVLLAQLPTLNLADILIFAQQNGSYSTWASTDGVTFIFDNGVLTGTRGMGFDLMTADVREPMQALQRANGRAVRVHRYLDGQGYLFIRVFVCDYSRQENGVVRERCKSPDYTFENQYWLGKGGTILKSRQWISPERGYLISERLS